MEGLSLAVLQQSGTDVDRFADLYQLQKDMVEKNQAVNVSHNNFFFLPVHSRAITVEQYQLATDSGGLAFRNQAADWVKKTIAGDSIDLIWKVVTNAETEQLEQSGIRQEQEVEDVLEQYGSKSEASGTLPGGAESAGGRASVPTRAVGFTGGSTDLDEKGTKERDTGSCDGWK